MQDLLKQLLQKNPNRRISFHAFFAHPFLSGEPLQRTTPMDTMPHVIVEEPPAQYGTIEDDYVILSIPERSEAAAGAARPGGRSGRGRARAAARGRERARSSSSGRSMSGSRAPGAPSPFSQAPCFACLIAQEAPAQCGTTEDNAVAVRFGMATGMAQSGKRSACGRTCGRRRAQRQLTRHVGFCVLPLAATFQTTSVPNIVCSIDRMPHKARTVRGLKCTDAQMNRHVQVGTGKLGCMHQWPRRHTQ